MGKQNTSNHQTINKNFIWLKKTNMQLYLYVNLLRGSSLSLEMTQSLGYAILYRSHHIPTLQPEKIKEK